MDCDSVLLDAASLTETLHVPKDQLSLNPDTGVTCELQLVCEDDFDVDTDNATMSPEHENVVGYMGGYLLRKFGFSDAHQRCVTCADLLLADRNACSTDNSSVFVRQKSFCDTSKLIYPSAAFRAFVVQLEGIFNNVFPQVQHSLKLMNRLVLYAEKNTNILGCEKQKRVAVMKDMMKLYMRIRIYSKIKALGSAAATAKTTGRRSRKVKKWFMSDSSVGLLTVCDRQKISH